MADRSILQNRRREMRNRNEIKLGNISWLFIRVKIFSCWKFFSFLSQSFRVVIDRLELDKTYRSYPFISWEYRLFGSSPLFVKIVKIRSCLLRSVLFESDPIHTPQILVYPRTWLLYSYSVVIFFSVLRLSLGWAAYQIINNA